MDRVFICLLLACGWLQAIACSCIGISTFCDAINQSKEWNVENLVIARGIVTGEVPINEYRTDKTFRITKAYYNPLGIEDFQIREGNGADCGRSLENLQIGDELIILTSVHQDSVFLLGSLSICMPAPLTVHGNKVTGYITRDEDHTMSISRFEKLHNCVGAAIAISIFPNPTSDVIRVHKFGKLGESNIANIEVFDVLGRLTFRHTLTSEERESPEFRMDARNWPAGTYFVAVANSEGKSIESVVVSH